MKIFSFIILSEYKGLYILLNLLKYGLKWVFTLGVQRLTKYFM